MHTKIPSVSFRTIILHQIRQIITKIIHAMRIYRHTKYAELCDYTVSHTNHFYYQFSADIKNHITLNSNYTMLLKYQEYMSRYSMAMTLKYSENYVKYHKFYCNNII